MAPASVPDTTSTTATLHKNAYAVVNSPHIEIWDKLAPNAVPDLKRPSVPPYKKKPTTAIPPTRTFIYPWSPATPPNPSSVTPKPTTESPSSFWPGFLNFFIGSETKTTVRPIIHTPRPVTPVPALAAFPPSRAKKNQTQMIKLSTKNVTMHHLSSDEQLTILKVDQDQDQTSNETSLKLSNNTEYIVLHKLPNGEALNLENLETYASMADVESGIKKENHMNHQPRSMEDLIISERPYVQPDIYEPIPLDQLEDLEAMPSVSNHPVYIINPLKGK